MNETKVGKVKGLVVTGGPQGGKTSGMAHTIQKMAGYGRETLVCEEAATILIKAGMRPGVNISFEDFQHEVLREQLHREKVIRQHAERRAQTGQDILILFDRGVMDGGAYVEPEKFKEILGQHNLDPDHTLRGRYDGVVFMTSVAKGRPDLYETHNGEVERSEKTPEEASILNDRTLQAWNGTEKMRIIKNDGEFPQKLNEMVQAEAGMIGIPVPYEIEDKYAVKKVDRRYLNSLNPIVAHITQFYIQTPEQKEGEIRRARRLVQGAFEKHFLTIKTLEGKGKNGEIEEPISKDTYRFMQKLQVPGTRIIEKDRRTFLHDDQYFEFDTFKAPFNALKPDDEGLLEIEKTYENQKVTIPHFMIVEESTGDPYYSNANIAGLNKVGI